MMMMKIKYSFFIAALISCVTMEAQTFISKGSITYERKVQMHKILENNSWFKGNLDKIPKFYSSRFELKFNPDSMTYSKLEDNDENNGSWAIYARDNETATLFRPNQSITKKTIYEDTYIIKDSIRSFRWKLVNETRTIAGIECKKATTIINDSVYIVAFYAENIMVSGGPEDFGGLPGMILGLVVPRLHVSYYAEKVETKNEVSLTMPKQKNKTVMTRKEFTEMVLKNMKWAFTNSSIGALYLFL
jgi:GLPGLI family protein